jgi:hypothetical protein
MVHIGLIKYTNMWDNGNIIVFGDKENCIKMMRHFFKETLKKD